MKSVTIRSKGSSSLDEVIVDGVDVATLVNRATLDARLGHVTTVTLTMPGLNAEASVEGRVIYRHDCADCLGHDDPVAWLHDHIAMPT